MREFLRAELSRRKARNPRYSLRAFARALGTHHSTLSQVMQSRRRLTARTIRQFGNRLGMTGAQIHDACLAEQCAAIRRLVHDERFRADSRWIAVMTGIPLDDVNVALHWLLYRREIVMSSSHTWTLLEQSNVEFGNTVADHLARS